jgi:hypothetical protein
VWAGGVAGDTAQGMSGGDDGEKTMATIVRTDQSPPSQARSMTAH